MVDLNKLNSLLLDVAVYTIFLPSATRQVLC